MNLRQAGDIREWHEQFTGAAFDAAEFAPVEEYSQEKVHPAFAPIALFRLAGSHNVRRWLKLTAFRPDSIAEFTFVDLEIANSPIPCKCAEKRKCPGAYAKEVGVGEPR